MDSAGFGLRGLTGLLLALNLGVLCVGLLAGYWPRHEPVMPAMNDEQVQLATGMPAAMNGAKAALVGPFPTPLPDGARCMTWRHIDSERVLSIEKTLRDAGIKLADRDWDVGEKLGWWVFLPPFSDASSLRAAVEDAHGRGVADAEPMHEGVMTNALSLGMFPDPDRARLHAEAMLGKGFKQVRYGLRPSVQAIRLVLVRPPSSGLLETIREAARGIMPEACSAGAQEENGKSYTTE